MQTQILICKLLIIYLLEANIFQTKNDTITIVGILVVASARILPSVSKILTNIQNFKFRLPSVELLNSEIIKMNEINLDIKEKNTIIISELPIGTWNEPYLQYLEKCIEGKKYGLKDYKDLSTDKDVHIELTFASQITLNDPATFDKIMDQFKATSSLSTNNMYLFNKDEILTNPTIKFNIIQERLRDFWRGCVNSTSFLTE